MANVDHTINYQHLRPLGHQTILFNLIKVSCTITVAIKVQPAVTGHCNERPTCFNMTLSQQKCVTFNYTGLSQAVIPPPHDQNRCLFTKKECLYPPPPHFHNGYFSVTSMFILIYYPYLT